MGYDLANATDMREDLELDPFAFVPNFASRILGLGGRGASAEPAYAFHTLYHYCATGIVTFRIKFRNLRGSMGNLTLRVNGTSPASNAIARTVKLTAAPLRDIVHLDGEMTISFRAKAGVLYALVGLVHGDCDAAADGLQVFLDRPGNGSEVTGEDGKLRFTTFGKGATRPVANLVNSREPTLTHPISQPCTKGQLNERAFDRWLERLNWQSPRDQDAWKLCYILQALEKYGVLQPGSRGIGFDVRDGDSLPAALASLGCSITVTAPPERAGALASNLSRPDICDMDRFGAAVDVRSIEAGDSIDIPAEFDFCWSHGVAERLGSIDAGQAFMAQSIGCLKMGGVAVHVTSYNLSSNDQTIDHAPVVLFRKKDFDRLAIDLVSNGHEVAQHTYEAGKGSILGEKAFSSAQEMSARPFVARAYGLIYRRGDLPL